MIVGLGHRKQVGKDTIAAELVKDGWQRVAFADPLRELALELDPRVRVEHLYGTLYPHLSQVVGDIGWDEAKKQTEVRRFLISLGGGARRVLDPDVWIDKAMKDIRGYRRNGIPVVVTDVRYPNEVYAIQDLGGIVVKVSRPSVVPTSDPTDSDNALADFTGWDGEVVNNGSIEGAVEALQSIIDSHYA